MEAVREMIDKVYRENKKQLTEVESRLKVIEVNSAINFYTLAVEQVSFTIEFDV